MIRSTLIHHVMSIKIGHRLTLKLFFFIEVVDDLFNVSFYLGVYLNEELRGIVFLFRLHNLISLLNFSYQIQYFRIRQKRWLLLVLLLWRPVDGRWLLFVSFYLDNGFRVRVYCLSEFLIDLTQKFQHLSLNIRI
jgi:hypothetical protein